MESPEKLSVQLPAEDTNDRYPGLFIDDASDVIAAHTADVMTATGQALRDFADAVADIPVNDNQIEQ